MTDLVVSPDGHRVASSSDDGTIILWDSHHFCRIVEEWIAHEGRIDGLAFSPDGQRLASRGDDGKICIWDVIQGSHRLQATLEPTSTTQLRCFALQWSPGGASIAAAYTNDNVYFRHTSTFQQVSVFEFDVDVLPTIRTLQSDSVPSQSHASHTHPRYICTFSHTNPWLAWVQDNNKDYVGIWDVASLMFKPFEGQLQNMSIKEVAISPCNTYITFGHRDGTVSVWSIETAKELCRWKAHTQSVDLVEFSPNGRLLLSASKDDTAKIWDIPSGTLRASLEGYDGLYPTTVRFSLCGQYVSTAFSAKRTSAKLWRVSDGSLATFTEHSSDVTCIVFSPDGSMLWTAAEDGTVFGNSLLDIIPEPLAS